MPTVGNSKALGAFSAGNLARLREKAAVRKAERDAKTAAAKAARKEPSAQRAAQEAREAAAADRRGSSRFRQARTDYDREQARPAQAGPPPHQEEVINLGAASMSSPGSGGGGVAIWKNGIVAGSGASQIFPGRFSRGSIPGFGFGNPAARGGRSR